MKKTLARIYHIYLLLVVLIYITSLGLAFDSTNFIENIQKISIGFLSTLYLSFGLITVFNYILDVVVEDNWYNIIKDILMLSLIFQLCGLLANYLIVYYPNADKKLIYILIMCAIYKIQKRYFAKNITYFYPIVIPLTFLNISFYLACNALSTIAQI